MARGTSCFLESLRRRKTQTQPFHHLLLEEALPEETRRRILELPIDAAPIEAFPGQREGNNPTRVFFAPEQCGQFPVCRDVVDTFLDSAVIAELESVCGIQLGGNSLRIEYCQDREGFWLEPHCDIAVKLFTLLIYLTDPSGEDLGTDIYDDELRWARRAPYGPNLGLIFLPGKDTWHGFEPRPFRGTRHLLIVNYVTSDWRSRDELAGAV